MDTKILAREVIWGGDIVLKEWGGVYCLVVDEGVFRYHQEFKRYEDALTAYNEEVERCNAED